MIDQTISHYTILEKLGEGGMGVVYRAHDTKLDRQVAMKFLPQDTLITDEEKTRFTTEAQAAAALNHPNICTIHKIDEVRGRTFIVMEHIEGQSLQDKMATEPLAIDEALGIAIQIAEGLRHAHERGVVHRDIKAGNIMVTSAGRPKIMDFGLAKVRGSVDITRAHQLMGTIAYMSPEQSSGDRVDHRTDVWSLGVLLYKMLTGQFPFRGGADESIIYAILNEDHPPVGDLRAGVPLELDHLVSAMLQKDRDRRVQTVDEVLTGLQEIRTAGREQGHSGAGKSIAVLPFRNISPEEEGDYFSDGLTEELLISLSRLKDIRVVSRTTCMRYKGTTKDIKSIGFEVGARYILEGSARRVREDLRISVQLVDVGSDRQLWAETYKGSFDEIFDIQENVSRQIVDALTLTLTPSEKVVLAKRSTLNPEAFDHYLRGRDFLYGRTKSKINSAIHHFEKALELDPRYAAAYAGLGETYATFYQDYERNEGLLEKSIEACLSALMYDSSLSEAYVALGLSYFQKKSIEEALQASQKAIALDPNSFAGYWILGRIYHSMGNDKEAVDCLEKVIALNPDFYTAYKDLTMSYEQIGKMDEYNRVLQASLDVYPQYLQKHPDEGRAYIYYAVNLAEVGRTEEAKQAAAKAIELSPTEPLMFYNAACFYSRIGENKLAVDALKGAVSAGFEYYDWIKADPDLENIRSEPGYLKLLEGN
jgi:serine/threonine protein kinase/Tfp pilus assembly protein PilF